MTVHYSQNTPQYTAMDNLKLIKAHEDFIVKWLNFKNDTYVVSKRLQSS